ncbi:hypothetical protein NVV30_08620 [Pseudomonas syringae]|uniref:hypothetical protein n=1 Tax=Pseudomonas syringae TaxID=317 RepID=UPI00215B4901|nr:hypothetical protein [Pseudomonas syringae]MCR8718755.1 hypothetical protein [Pseudomonas syringae]
MFNIIKSHKALLFFSLIFFISAAMFQISIPHYIYTGIKDVGDRSALVTSLQLLAFVAVSKTACQVIANTLGARLEAGVRFYLIAVVAQSHALSGVGKQLTLIKEDAERVSSATGGFLVLVSSAALTAVTSYYLLLDSIYFALPLILIFSGIAVYISYMRPKVATNYRVELEKDEAYKHSVSDLIELSESKHKFDKADFEAAHRLLEDSVSARYKYERWNATLAFFPEISIASCTAILLALTSIFFPDVFSAKLIVYMSYLGMISMSSSHAVEMALTLVGVDQSIKRFTGGVHATE